MINKEAIIFCGILGKLSEFLRQEFCWSTTGSSLFLVRGSAPAGQFRETVPGNKQTIRGLPAVRTIFKKNKHFVVHKYCTLTLHGLLSICRADHWPASYVTLTSQATEIRIFRPIYLALFAIISSSSNDVFDDNL